jgi:zinc D-Ala-D-Ala carboxypeptidase
MYDDIPEASRQPVKESSRGNAPPSKTRPRIGPSLLALIVGGGLLVLGLLAIALLLRPKAQPIVQSSTSPTATVAASATPASPPTTSGTATAPNNNSINDSNNDSNAPLLGHQPYSEAPAEELEPVASDGQIKLRNAATESYRRMTAAAAADGVNLLPISGFRSIADQNNLFFRVKEERNQGVSKRAEVSAPPGHSEHHTGYAVDIGDGAQPETSLSQGFEKTAAFRWLTDHAARYSFEMSFMKGNPQGVSYEPWHWRFVGDRNSLETFYRAQHPKPGTP